MVLILGSLLMPPTQKTSATSEGGLHPPPHFFRWICGREGSFGHQQLMMSGSGSKGSPLPGSGTGVVAALHRRFSEAFESIQFQVGHHGPARISSELVGNVRAGPDLPELFRAVPSKQQYNPRPALTTNLP